MVARKKLRKHNKVKRTDRQLSNNLSRSNTRTLAAAKVD
jgi:hypothetical protein